MARGEVCMSRKLRRTKFVSRVCRPCLTVTVMLFIVPDGATNGYIIGIIVLIR